MTVVSPLFAPIEPRESGMLETPDGHSLYFELSGTESAVPIVFLHGGPGSGTSPWQRQLFNPQKFNIILFDQRGSGKSLPHASLENNTTSHLVQDLELLRTTLGIERWIVFGGSWGSTLGLVYANSYPERVLSLVVYGVFLARMSELQDLYFEGGVVSRLFPDVFRPFIELLDPDKRTDPIAGYCELFQSTDEQMRSRALELWTFLEARVARLTVDEVDLEVYLASKSKLLAHSLLENHYFREKGFIDGNALLTSLGERTKAFPVHIVQGRYDLVCPFVTAYEVHRAIPHSILHTVEDVGHSAKDPKMQRKLIDVLNRVA